MKDVVRLGRFTLDFRNDQVILLENLNEAWVVIDLTFENFGPAGEHALFLQAQGRCKQPNGRPAGTVALMAKTAQDFIQAPGISAY